MSAVTERTMTRFQEVPKRRVLRSWKEVAVFLGATVRSAQRWEKTAGLPVHRQGGGLRSRIYAWSDELEEWQLSGCAPAAEPEGPTVRSRSRLWLYAGAAALALTAVAALLFWRFGAVFPGARVPAIWKFENSTLTILDHVGRLCWMKQFPVFDAGFEREVRDKVLIADIDGDGRREVLLNFLPPSFGENGGALMCFEPGGRLRWQFRYGGPKTFGSRSFSAGYRGRFIRPVTFAGRPHVLTVANHYLWYPSQTALLDPATGRLEAEYWHPGAISECVLSDLDGDGRPEVLLGGMNNPGQGLGHAALAVLRLPFPSLPRHPANTDFASLTGGGELDYLLFPEPDVARSVGLVPRIIRMDADRPRHLLVETTLAETGGIIYDLDSDLHVEDVRFSDNFFDLHNRLHLTHVLNHQLGQEELASLRTPVHFSAAPDGNSPALSRFWKF